MEPPPTPITLTRPPVASDRTSSARFGPPISSSTTLNGPCSTNPSGATAVAPKAATRWRISALRTVAMTVAPAATASWTPAMPTPPAAPCTHTRSPSNRPHCVKRASLAVVKTSGNAPASSQDTPSGTRHQVTLGDDCFLSLATAADHGHDPVAHVEPARSRAEGEHLTGQLHARDVGGDPGRRG